MKLANPAAWVPMLVAVVLGGCSGSAASPAPADAPSGDVGQGPSPGLAPPPSPSPTTPRCSIVGRVRRSSSFQGSPACMSAEKSKGPLNILVMRATSTCTSSSGGQCLSEEPCMFGYCLVERVIAAPRQPDLSTPEMEASYCVGQLSPGPYHLFAYYDCDDNNWLTAGDLTSVNPPGLEVSVAAGAATEKVIVLDRECDAVCKSAFRR